MSINKINKTDIDFHRLPYRVICKEQILKKSPVESLQTSSDSSSNDYKNNFLKTSNRTTLSLSRLLKKIGCDTKVSYVKSGSYGHTFRTNWKSNDENNYIIPIAIKVVAYPKKQGIIENESRPENAEVRMLHLLSELVLDNVTPHLILPYMTFKAPLTQFKLSRESSPKKYKDFLDKCEKNVFHDEVSVLMSEWSNGGDLANFIRKYNKKLKLSTWKNIFFQVIATLAAIQRKYPTFRHNDLKLNNILVTLLKKKDNKYWSSYLFGDNVGFIVPSEGLILKIWDFDFACIPGIIDNEKVNAEWTTTRCNVSSNQNKYYDLHYFFCTLNLFYPDLMKEGGSPIEIQKFVRRILPREYRIGKDKVSKKGRLMVDIEYITPEDVLLKDPLFESYRKAAINYKKKKNKF